MSAGTDTAPLLSAAIIARNEAANIRVCLESLREVADEVVVVDTGSTDETRQISHDLGARVVEAPWEDDFAAARNRSIEQLAGEWILIIDADEELDLVNGVRLRRALSRADPQTIAFLITIISDAGSRDSDVDIRHVYPRLLRNRQGIRFEGAIHERPVLADGRNVAEHAGALPISILHRGYADAVKNRARAQRNLQILRREAERRPESIDVAMQLGAALLVAGNACAARRALEQLLEQGLDASREVMVRESLALAASRMQDDEGAARQLERVLEVAPLRRGARLALVRLLMVTGRAQEALAIVEELARDASGDGAVAEVRPNSLMLMRVEIECLLELGELDRARTRVDELERADDRGRSVERFRQRIDAIAARQRPAGQRVSAAIIARNAADEIEGCLASLAGAVDEIHVVDTGSSDATYEVASAAGAVVSRLAWTDDFSRARNAAIDEASGDWMLIIDADERLAAGSGEVIRSAIGSGEADAFRLEIRSDTEPSDPIARRADRVVRLFRKLPGVRYSRRVHEQIEPGLATVGARVATISAVIEHTGYADPLANRSKAERNLRLLELEGAVDGHVAFHTGMALLGLGRRDEASEWLRTALEPSRGLPSPIVAHTHARLAHLHLLAARIEDAALHIDEASAIAPDDVFVRYVRAGVRYAQARFSEAEDDLESIAASSGHHIRTELLRADLDDVRRRAGRGRPIGSAA